MRVSASLYYLYLHCSTACISIALLRLTEREDEREAEQRRSRLERRVGGELEVAAEQFDDVVGETVSLDLVVTCIRAH